mmetsp:Transcript_21485/g.15370  ORF Transcript_21485/g.15370 Transcript_21485/m.15370 type:complete len:138 (+) Transcript_21485:445-858(+)
MSESQAFSWISEDLKPDFFINLGDMHYAGTKKANKNFFEMAYHEVFKSQQQRQFYESTPLVYTLDDHDTGPNNSNGLTASTPLAMEAYRSIIPSYSLQSSDPSDPRGIYQKFRQGNTLFLMTDSRSYLFTDTEDGQQ